MLHLLDRGLAGGDLVHDGIVLVAANEPTDHSVKRRREQQGLVIGLGAAQNPLDLGHEAHVGHPVCLVDHDPLNIGDRELAPLNQVDHATRGGHNQLNTLFEGRNLLFDRRSPVDRKDRDVPDLGQWLDLTADLHCQLTGGYQGQTSWTSGLGIGQQLHKRKTKGQGLARPRLGTPAHVASGQAIWDGEGLYLERG